MPQPGEHNGNEHFHGAAILREDGSEQPITEAMIQQACQQLEGSEAGYPTAPCDTGSRRA